MVKITQSFSYLKTAAVREERFESAKPNFEKIFSSLDGFTALKPTICITPALIKKETRGERERKSPTTPVRKLVVRDNLLVPIIIIELLRAAAAVEDDPS